MHVKQHTTDVVVDYLEAAVAGQRNYNRRKVAALTPVRLRFLSIRQPNEYIVNDACFEQKTVIKHGPYVFQ